MRKISTTFLFLIALGLTNFAQAPDWTWANIIGSFGEERPHCITTDLDGNCYLAGVFNSSLMYVGTEVFSNQGFYDIILIKYSSDGSIIWAKSFGGDNDDFPGDICIKNNKIYLTGYYKSTELEFDTVILQDFGNNNWNVFITCLDLDGNVTYAEGYGGTWDDMGISIAVDHESSYYVSGYFSSDEFHIRDTTLYISGYNTWDIFLMKFNAEHNLEWIKKSSNGRFNYLSDMCLTEDEHIYLSGTFYNDFIIFDTCQIDAFDDGGLFLVKYDKHGNIKLAQNYTYYEEYNKGSGYSIISDYNNNILIAGWFYGSKLIFGNDTLINQAAWSLFTCKFDSLGNQLWTAGAPCYFGSSRAVVTDINGDIYIAGRLDDYTSNGDTAFFSDSVYCIIYGQASFVTKYNYDGIAQWTKTNSSPDDDYIMAEGLAIDNLGNLYTTGWWEGYTITFGNQTYGTNGARDMYLVKLGQTIVSVPTYAENTKELIVYPNPSQDYIHIKDEACVIAYYEYRIFDLQGRMVKSGTNNMDQHTIYIGEIPGGVYILSILTENKHTKNVKIIKR